MVAYCNVCRIEGTKFVVEPFFRQTDKPTALLKGWSIDLIINKEPVSPERYCYCIAAIDCFIKWTEVWPI